MLNVYKFNNLVKIILSAICIKFYKYLKFYKFNFSVLKNFFSCHESKKLKKNVQNNNKVSK